MHFKVLVTIPQTENPGHAVDQALAPFQERYPDDDGPPTGFWDFYQIGGRYTGALDGYDPSADPQNIETCFLCRGTGRRTDMEVRNGCNGCAGKGRALKWPTEWKAHAGDVAPALTVLRLEQAADCFAVLHAGVYVTRDDVPDFDTKARALIQEAADAGLLVAVVDCHV